MAQLDYYSEVFIQFRCWSWRNWESIRGCFAVYSSWYLESWTDPVATCSIREAQSFLILFRLSLPPSILQFQSYISTWSFLLLSTVHDDSSLWRWSRVNRREVSVVKARISQVQPRLTATCYFRQVYRYVLPVPSADLNQSHFAFYY